MAFVPAYRCGAVPESHRIPFSFSVEGETIGMKPTLYGGMGWAQYYLLWINEAVGLGSGKAAENTAGAGRGRGQGYLRADGDAGEGDHDASADGKAEDAGGLEDLSEEMVRDLGAHGVILRAGDDCVVVDAA